MEASGTGNMKLALNGALTIGTLDGANIEIRDHVGAENIAIFGMEATDVTVRRKQGLDATDVIRQSPRLARAINAIGSGEFSPGEPSRFASIAHALRYLDHYMVSADFDSYYEAQRGIDARWQVMPAWTRASILNVARMAWFSSDRTIREYAEEIWNVPVRPGAAGRRRARACAARAACAEIHYLGVIEICLMAIILSALSPRHCEERMRRAIHLATSEIWIARRFVPRNDEMLREFMLTKAAAPVRRRHPRHRRRQPLAGTHQPGLLGLCRPVRRLHRRDHPARADRASAARGRSAGDHRELLRADRGRRIRSRRPPGEGQPLLAALVRGAGQGGGDVATLATAVFAERRPSWSHQQAQDAGGEAVRGDPALPRMSPRPGSSNMISASSRASRISRRAEGAAGQRLFEAVDRRPRAAQDRHAVADVDVGRVLRPRVSTRGANWCRSARCR